MSGASFIACGSSDKRKNSFLSSCLVRHDVMVRLKTVGAGGVGAPRAALPLYPSPCFAARPREGP
jgi:hypothetical protein